MGQAALDTIRQIQRRTDRSSRGVSRLFATVAVLVTSVGGTNAVAQTATISGPTGIQPNRAYLSQLPFENVDTLSGSLVLTFTDLVLPGNAGHDLKFQRTWNSQLDRAGWSFGLAGIVMTVFDPGLPPPGTQNTDPYLPHVYTADGAEHPTVWLNNSATSAEWTTTAEFWRYEHTARTLWMPDGSHYLYGTDGLLLEGHDQWGTTFLWVTRDGATTHYFQRVGGSTADVREVVVTTTNGVVTSMVYGSKTWSYDWNTPTPGLQVLTTVTPPTGPAWHYEYTAADPAELTQVRTPQGGEVNYSYLIHQFGREQDVPNSTFVNARVLHTRAVGGRAIATGTWTFSYEEGTQQEPIQGARTTITTPSLATIILLHDNIVGVGYSPSLGGDWGLRSRTIKSPQGVVLEEETLEYQTLPVVTYIPAGGTPAVASRDILRDGRHHKTTYIYVCDVAAHLCDFHRPRTITESVDNVVKRTTARTYDYTFTPAIGISQWMIFGASNETVTVGTQSYSVSRTYDAQTGFVVSETRNGLTTQYLWGLYGNLGRLIKPHGEVTLFEFSKGVLSKITRPKTVVERVVNADGTIQSETRDQRTTTFTYDGLFRVLTTQPPGASTLISTDYHDSDGTAITVTRGTQSTTTALDGFGRPTGMTNAMGVTTTVTFDAEGRKTFESYPFTTTSRGTSFEYDALGRVTKRTNPDLAATHVDYTYGTGTLTIKDEKDRLTVQTREAFGDPDELRIVAVTDAKSQTWTYGYNARGRLTSVTAPDSVQRTWNFDVAHDRLDSETHPESGTTSYTYDANGNLATKQDANGTQFVYQYDENDRLKQTTAGAYVATIDYYPNEDKRKRSTADGVVSDFHYDAAGRLDKRLDTVDTTAFETAFAYDGRDNVTGIKYPTGRQLTYVYDDANQVTSVFDGSRTYASGIQYHPSGAIAELAAGNNVTHTTSFDPYRYWVRSITAVPLQLNYNDYDAVGNVGTLADSRSGYGQTFTYDELDRLTQASGQYGQAVFAYDAHGNRQTVGNTSYTIEAQTLRMTSQGSSTFTYFANGNLWTAPNATYAYTPSNQLSSATIGSATTSYKYDADEWRVKKGDNSGATYYLRGLKGELLVEWRVPNSSSMATREYIYVGDRLLAAVAR